MLRRQERLSVFLSEIGAAGPFLCAYTAFIKKIGMCVHLFPVDTIIYRVFYSGLDVHGFCLSSLLFFLHKQFTTLFSMFVRTLLFLSCGGVQISKCHFVLKSDLTCYVFLIKL